MDMKTDGGKLRRVGQGQRLMRQVSGFPCDRVRFPRQGEHGLTGLDESLVSHNSVAHLFDGLFL